MGAGALGLSAALAARRNEGLARVLQRFKQGEKARSAAAGAAVAARVGGGAANLRPLRRAAVV